MIEDDRQASIRASARIGEQLRAGRKRRYPNDTQADFARRLGVSRYTYQKMEKGDTKVAMGSYLKAAQLLGILDRFVAGLEPPRRSIFERSL
jgi:transcriptional regulator with XRE-family HTH domain